MNEKSLHTQNEGEKVINEQNISIKGKKEILIQIN